MKEKLGYLIIFIFIIFLAGSGSAIEEAPLQGNDGISNILLVYDSASEDGTTNDEISLILQLYSCREEGINYIQDCLDNNPNVVSLKSIMDTTELLGVENSDGEGEAEYLENIYFQEGENTLVSSDKNTHYDMYDGLIDGSFVSESDEEFERSIYVKNQETEEDMEFEGLDKELKNPPAGGWWGDSSESEVVEDSVYDMNGETDFHVEVRDEKGNVLQEETFSFTPNGREDEENEENTDDGSGGIDFGTSDINLIEPVDSISDSNPSFKWRVDHGEISTLDTVELVVDDDDNLETKPIFEKKVSEFYRETDTDVTYNDAELDLSSGEYYWALRVNDDGGQSTLEVSTSFRVE